MTLLEKLEEVEKRTYEFQDEIKHLRMINHNLEKTIEKLKSENEELKNKLNMA
jgi:predicted nuclease with TOPRIM domain